MDSYTITIAPNNDSGAATRLVVETSGDQVRITDVHLHAPQGLSSGHIPSVDFDLLLQALTGTASAPTDTSRAAATALSASQQASNPALEAGTATEPAEQPPTPTTLKGRGRKAAPRTDAAPAPRPGRARTTAASRDETTTPQRAARTAATPKTRTGKQSPVKVASTAATAKTPPAPANKPTSKRAPAPAKRQTPAKRTPKAATAAATAAGGRVYRRTPDDLAVIFEQIGSVAGIAEHYEVPRYTAQGWVSRLRATT
jgi:outer membrane biosynthesis protein TonB